jgi:acetate kinase
LILCIRNQEQVLSVNNNEPYILTVNAGSSSVKFDLFAQNTAFERVLEGAIIGIGQNDASLTIKDVSQTHNVAKQVDAPTHDAAANLLISWLKDTIAHDHITVVGHRIVHGGPAYYAARVITPQVIDELHTLIPFDPEHLPIEINLIKSLQNLLPDTPQVACFDTSFHHDLPREAQLLAIPRRYSKQGLRRYGFHGLSYSFLLAKLQDTIGEAANGRLILAHLGNGVSLAAIDKGKSIDTTMGLTPAGGVPMSARSGDLDPGLISYLARTEGIDAKGFDNLVNFQSGLLGVSETTSDMEELLKHEANDERAAEAITLFCYQVKKSIGSLSAALGGLDQLVFSGGMGENAPKVRARICAGLGFLGIVINEGRNTANADVISSENSRVTVRVMHTDEAWVIARDTAAALKGEQESTAHTDKESDG